MHLTPQDNLGNSNGQKVRGILNTKRPITFHDLFLHKSMNTAKEKKLLTNVAPIFGDESTTYGGDKVVRVRHNGVELRERLIMKEIVPEPANVSDTNPGFVFGFAPSKSLWLYPYVYRQQCKGSGWRLAKQLSQLGIKHNRGPTKSSLNDTIRTVLLRRE